MRYCSVVCKKVCFQIEGNEIINNFCISLNPENVLILRGGNGSGKTTLLRLLSGILECSSGHIVVNGSLAYFSHKNSFKDDLSVYQNLVFWSELYKNKNDIERVVKMLSIEEKLRVEYGMLSQGWKRRIAFARILILNAQIWLLDEPYSNLDASSIIILNKIIEEHSERGGIVVLSTHGNKNPGLKTESMITSSLS